MDGAGKLRNIMLNVEGPPRSKILILSEIVHLILLYAAPIWSEIVDVAQYGTLLERAQRTVLVTVVTGV